MSYVTQCFPALADAGVRGDAKQARPCKKPYTGTIGNCKRIKNSNKSQAKVKKEADRLGGKRTQREDAKSKARRKKIAKLRENLAAKDLKGKGSGIKDGYVKTAKNKSAENNKRLKNVSRNPRVNNNIVERNEVELVNKTLDKRARRGKNATVKYTGSYDPQGGKARRGNRSETYEETVSGVNSNKKKKTKNKAKPENLKDLKIDDDPSDEELNDLLLELDNKITRKPKSVGGPGKGTSKAQQKRDSDAFLRDQGFDQEIIDALNRMDEDEKRAMQGLPPKKKKSDKAKGFGTKKKSRKKRK